VSKNQNDRPTRMPAIPTATDEVTAALKEAVEIGAGQRGKALDRYVRLRELRDAGLVVVDGRRGLILGVGAGDGTDVGPFEPDPDGPPDFGVGDLTPPVAPTNVRARGLNLNTIGVTWDPPAYNNHAYAEIFASMSDNWLEIAATFNVGRPIGAGNSTQYFMGTAAGTTFIHSGLEDTVPAADFERPILTIFDQSGPGITIRLRGVSAGAFVSPGDRIYLTTAGSNWDSTGQQGTVQSTNSTDIVVLMDGGDDAVTPPPSDAMVVAIPEEDDLEAALSPTPVYYWVRFVSTAGVAGPVQSEAGVPGTVMLNPEQILNILTGRIRRTNLANDVVAPINWISGPINDFPSVRDFVESLSGNAVAEFDALLYQFYIGALNPDAATGGAALSQIRGFVDETGGFIEALNTIQLGGQWDSDDSPFGTLIATIVGRRLVELDDSSALAYIGDTLQIAVGDPDNPDMVLLNQVAQQVYINQDSIDNSITMKVQVNAGGVLTSAGFGIGLQTDPDDPGELVSTFIVAADQFAIMGAANGGRICQSVSRIPATGSTPARLAFLLGGAAGTGDNLEVGTNVAVTFPRDAPAGVQAGFRGRTFKIVSRSGGTPIQVLVEAADGGTVSNINSVLGPSYAMFPEQSVPFIVDTASGTVGIRGRLIVDGMISTNELEVNDLLRANEIWATAITAFGLIRSPLLVGEVITTPLFGGWGVKIAMEDTGFDNRVIEFSRWGVTTQTPPSDPDGVGSFANPLLYPQMAASEPDDTSFYLNASDGSVFVRGNLTVGGNARIWTGYNTLAQHFIQMDHEFPLFVMDRNRAQAAGIPINEARGMVYTSAIRNAIRRDALFWVNQNGTMGFNTQNGAIFAGDTPLEPPNGTGDISVLARLASDGGVTGLGRVHAIANFDLHVNQNVTNWWVNVSINMFLADRNGNYDDSVETIKPSERNGLNGGPAILNPAFLDKHFLIIRASSNSGPDPGLAAFVSWRSRHPELIDMAQTGGIGPGQRTAHGTAKDVPASSNYKILIVLIERFDQDGNPLGGSMPEKVYPFSGNIFCQQVSNTQ